MAWTKWAKYRHLDWGEVYSDSKCDSAVSIFDVPTFLQPGKPVGEQYVTPNHEGADRRPVGENWGAILTVLAVPTWSRVGVSLSGRFGFNKERYRGKEGFAEGALSELAARARSDQKLLSMDQLT